MDPVRPLSTMIDQAEELIGHSPHPAIVAIPLGAWAVSNVCDALAMATGDEGYDTTARVSMGIGLVAAVGAAATGIRDYSFIPESRPSHGVATRHGLGNALAGSLYATSFALRLRDHRAGRPTSPLARALACCGGGVALYTAWLGGKLVEEYGEAVKPVMDERSREEHGRGAWLNHPSARGRERLDPTSPLGSHEG